MSAALPTSMEFGLGVNAHGQPVRLRYSTDYMQRGTWSIHRDAADQRDTTAAVGGLTTENIEQIAAIAASYRRSGGT